MITLAILPLFLVGIPIYALAQETSVAPQPLSIEGATTYVYKSINDVDLRLHLFTPANHSPSNLRPAILFFFGGGWTSGSVQQFVPQSRHLANRGMVAVVVDYRVFGRHKTSPFEAMADAKSSVRWMRSHATELGIDADRIVLSGGSAGGHVALSTAIFGSPDESGEDRPISSRPNALVLFNPSVDTTKSSTERFLGRNMEASPVHNVGPDLPPALILHGQADTTVPYADAEQFCEKAKSLGNRCELIGYEGAQHGFFNPPNENGKWYRETLLETDRFLTALGFLPEPAPTEIND